MSDAIEGEIVSGDVNQTQTVRLTKHDETIVQLLEAALNNAFNITEACQYAGISRETYYNWLGDDDIFSYRMSVAQSAPHRKAKQNVITAISQGDPNISLRFLTLRDPDFKPKAEVTNTPELDETRKKLKDFFDDKSDDNDDAGSEPPATDASETRGEVAEAPTDIS